MKGRRAIAAVLLATSAACMGPRRAVLQPGEYISTERPKRIWLTRADGTVVLVDAPRIFGDTLFGWTETEMGGEEVWLGLPQIQRVEVRRVDSLRTGLLIAGVGILTIVAFASLVETGGESGPPLNLEDDDSRVWFGRR